MAIIISCLALGGLLLGPWALRGAQRLSAAGADGLARWAGWVLGVPAAAGMAWLMLRWNGPAWLAVAAMLYPPALLLFAPERRQRLRAVIGLMLSGLVLLIASLCGLWGVPQGGVATLVLVLLPGLLAVSLAPPYLAAGRRMVSPAVAGALALFVVLTEAGLRRSPDLFAWVAPLCISHERLVATLAGGPAGGTLSAAMEMALDCRVQQEAGPATLVRGNPLRAGLREGNMQTGPSARFGLQAFSEPRGTLAYAQACGAVPGPSIWGPPWAHRPGLAWRIRDASWRMSARYQVICPGLPTAEGGPPPGAMQGGDRGP